jgi:hypothetical protein
VKSLFKPLFVIALLVCTLAQAAMVPIPAELNTCPQHSMQQMASSGESMSHASCCKFTGCECLQAPALASLGPAAPAFPGAADCTAALYSGVVLTLACSLFRPPIP